LEASLGGQFWRPVLEDSFGGQFWRIVLEASFGGQFWRAVLEDSLEQARELGRIAISHLTLL
jgi:hypothetical protein